MRASQLPEIRSKEISGINSKMPGTSAFCAKAIADKASDLGPPTIALHIVRRDVSGQSMKVVEVCIRVLAVEGRKAVSRRTSEP